MIFGLSTPLWLANNWRMIVGAIIGALLITPLSYCAGKRDGTAAANAKVQIAAQKVIAAAARAEAAANLADMARRAKTTEEVRQLQEIVDHEATEDIAGPGVVGVLDRLRAKAGDRNEAAR